MGTQNTDSVGYYSLSNGAVLNVGTSEYIGVSGVGTFDQSPGTNTVGSGSLGGNLEIGYNTASLIKDAGEGRYLLSGNGVLNVHGTVDVGFFGFGLFVQSGGVATISTGQGMELGSQSDPVSEAAGGGVATFSGGTCTVNLVSVGGTPSTIGGAGTLGINTAGHLIVAGDGGTWRG